MNVVLKFVVADREWKISFLVSGMKSYTEVDTRRSGRQVLCGPGKSSLAGTEC